MNFDRLIKDLQRREDGWRKMKEDPHNLAMPVMMALFEVRMAIRKEMGIAARDAELKRIEKRKASSKITYGAK